MNFFIFYFRIPLGLNSEMLASLFWIFSTKHKININWKEIKLMKKRPESDIYLWKLHIILKERTGHLDLTKQLFSLLHSNSILFYIFINNNLYIIFLTKPFAAKMLKFPKFYLLLQIYLCISDILKWVCSDNLINKKIKETPFYTERV